MHIKPILSAPHITVYALMLYQRKMSLKASATERTKPIKRWPAGVLTQTGPQTDMAKSYKLLWCLNKTHINLSSVIFSVEISHFEVLPFNLHLTFVSCAPRRPILTAEAFRSQKRPAAIDGISAHLSAAVPGWGVRNWLFVLPQVVCHFLARSLFSSVSETHFKKA